MYRHPTTRPRTLLAFTCTAVVIALSGLPSATDAGARQVRARIAGTCKLKGQERKLGPTYVTYISVGGGASCGQAFTLIRNYYHCRLKHGGHAGHCSGVEGFRCSEHRFLVIKVQFNARVTCTRGRETIRHEFTQFT